MVKGKSIPRPCIEIYFAFHNGSGGTRRGLLTRSGQRPRMLLNTPSAQDSPPPTKKYPPETSALGE